MARIQPSGGAWLAIPWLLLVVAGFYPVLDHEISTGEWIEHGPECWPGESGLKPAPGTFNLVLFAHPRCPCTRATLGELSILMAHCQGRLHARVLFLRPEHFPAGWERTDIWAAAELIPGVEVLADDGGAEAARFGAGISGTVLLYDSSGQLAFRGGITSSRGHSGDNAGRDAIVSLVGPGPERPVPRATPVFGCSLAVPLPSTEAMHESS